MNFEEIKVLEKVQKNKISEGLEKIVILENPEKIEIHIRKILNKLKFLKCHKDRISVKFQENLNSLKSRKMKILRNLEEADILENVGETKFCKIRKNSKF